MQVESHSQSQSEQQLQHIPAHDISNLPAQQLFALAQKKYQQLDYESALEFYELAYKKDPYNQNITLCYANLLKQTEKSNKAKKILQLSITNQPKGSSVHKRFFQLAELYDGEQAIKCFEKGIAEAVSLLKNPFAIQTQNSQQKPISKKKAKKNKKQGALASLIKQEQGNKTTNQTKSKSQTIQNSLISQTKTMIASAYASIAQICLTQLIDVPAAESVCVNALKKGQQYDPQCLDVQLNWGTYLLAKEDDQNAEKRIFHLQNMLMKMRASQDKRDTDFISDLPYQLSLECCRQLIQIGKFKECIQLLQIINDEIANGKQAQVIYFLAFCHFQLQQFDKCEQYVYLYEDLNEDNNQMGEVDQDIHNQIMQLKKQLKTKKPTTVLAAQTEDMDVEGQQQWEDVEDDQDM